MNYLSNCDRYGAALGEAAAFFRQIAFEIDSQPDGITKYQSHPAINNLVFTEKQTCLERVKSYEALGYGDAGVLLACPGPSLAGMVIDEVGNDEQKNFFEHYVKTEKARTFLAVTEPQYGSHLGSLTTRLNSSNHLAILNGEKWLVGHGGTGSIGVVIIKTSDGPLGVRALLLTPQELQQHNIERYILPMTGLRGARIGRLIFKDARVDKNYLLGSHLSATEYGMMALIKTFNRMRPCVGALAIGTAQAVVDYVYKVKSHLYGSQKTLLCLLNHKISAARELLFKAACRVEENPYESGFSSLAKVTATHLAEETIKMVTKILGKGCFIHHPNLEKWYRDIWGFEYMEGTQNMHRKNTFNAYHSDYLKFNLDQ